MRGTAFARKAVPAGWIEIDSTHLDAPGSLNPPIDPYAMAAHGPAPPTRAGAIEAGAAADTAPCAGIGTPRPSR